MDRLVKKGLEHKGFGVVEILSQCPTHFGRYALGSGSPEKLLAWIEGICVQKPEKAETGTAGETRGKLPLGEFVHATRPVFRGSTFFDLDDDAGMEGGR
jgi:2-oxoglutarate ferredoxin oxidoreductase subunit beta